jgi:hypothetical protein
VLGQFVPTGLVPRLAEELRGSGVDVPAKLFQPVPGFEG